jgi:hypothetical protein
MGCTSNKPKKNLPGVPLVYFAFDGQILNDGLLGVFLWGNDNRLFDKGIQGQAIDFSASTQSQRPLLVTFPDQYDPSGYEGFTFLMWLRKSRAATDSCVAVADCHFFEPGKFRGWRLIALPNNEYCWEMSDGKNNWRFNWRDESAESTNGWMQWGFNFAKTKKEVRLFVNGQNRAVIGVDRLDSLYFSGVLELGGSLQLRNFSQRLFPGSIDLLSFWGRPLLASEVAAIYKNDARRPVTLNQVKGDVKVLTFNASCVNNCPSYWINACRAIKSAGAQVVLLQNAARFGPFFAKQSQGNAYLRGDGFCIVSQLPLGETHRSVREKNAAAVDIIAQKKFRFVAVTCLLGAYPLVDELFQPSGVDLYTFIDNEKKRRGTELRLLMGAMLSVANSNPEVPICMGIELNSGSHLDWTERNSANRNNMSVNFELTQLLQHDGFGDTYRQYYPNEVLFQGYNAQRGNAHVYNNREEFLFVKGTQLKLLESKIVAVVPDSLPHAELAVLSEFEIVD